MFGGGEQEFREGDRAWPGAAIVELPDLSSVHLEARLDESDRGRLKANQEATVRIEAIPGRDFKARINDISVLARVDFSSGWPPTKNFGLNLILVDGDAKIRPGMSAVARIAVERVPDVLLVPAESVFQRDGAPIVYRLDGPAFDGNAPSRFSGAAREQSIVASGLAPGDRIAQRRPARGADQEDRLKRRVLLVAIVVAHPRRRRSHRHRRAHGCPSADPRCRRPASARSR